MSSFGVSTRSKLNLDRFRFTACEQCPMAIIVCGDRSSTSFACFFSFTCRLTVAPSLNDPRLAARVFMAPFQFLLLAAFLVSPPPSFLSSCSLNYFICSSDLALLCALCGRISKIARAFFFFSSFVTPHAPLCLSMHTDTLTSALYTARRAHIHAHNRQEYLSISIVRVLGTTYTYEPCSVSPIATHTRARSLARCSRRGPSR